MSQDCRPELTSFTLAMEGEGRSGGLSRMFLRARSGTSFVPARVQSHGWSHSASATEAGSPASLCAREQEVTCRHLTMSPPHLGLTPSSSASRLRDHGQTSAFILGCLRYRMYIISTASVKVKCFTSRYSWNTDFLPFIVKHQQSWRPRLTYVPKPEASLTLS